MPINYKNYPSEWKEISVFVRFQRANGQCECLGECKCHEIGAKMRALQPKPARELRPAGWRPQTVIENEARQSELL